MADPQTNPPAGSLDPGSPVVPKETAEQFPELIEMILASPSMNLEERQYWIDVLPIMNDEQKQNLRDILTNEKKQIEQSTQAYTESVKKTEKKVQVNFDSFEYKERKRLTHEAEMQAEKEEAKSEEELLKQLNTI